MNGKKLGVFAVLIFNINVSIVFQQLLGYFIFSG